MFRRSEIVEWLNNLLTTAKRFEFQPLSCSCDSHVISTFTKLLYSLRCYLMERFQLQGNNNYKSDLCISNLRNYRISIDCYKKIEIKLTELFIRKSNVLIKIYSKIISNLYTNAYFFHFDFFVTSSIFCVILLRIGNMCMFKLSITDKMRYLCLGWECEWVWIFGYDRCSK